MLRNQKEKNVAKKKVASLRKMAANHCKKKVAPSEKSCLKKLLS